MAIRKPTLKHVVALTLIGALLFLLVSLGFWQLNRAQQKRDWLAKVEPSENEITYLKDAPITFKDSGLEKQRSKKVERLELEAAPQPEKIAIKLRGQFLEHYHLLQDNVFHNGRLGYRVLSLFGEQDSHYAVWVDRGWIAQNRLKSELPEVTSESGVISVGGILAKWSENRWQLEVSPNGNWPLVVLRPMNAAVNQALENDTGRKIISAILSLDAKSPHVFTFSERDLAAMPPEKHIGYAIQWFALAITLVVLTTLFIYKQMRIENNEISE